MSGKGEAVPVAATETSSDLTPEFTWDEMWAEIDAALIPGGSKALLRPDDITIEKVMERYNVSDTTAKERMKKLARLLPDRFELLKVWNEKTRHTLWAIRVRPATDTKP